MDQNTEQDTKQNTKQSTEYRFFDAHLHLQVSQLAEKHELT